VDPESLRHMVTESDRCARELADARLDVVAYACLIAIMASGPGAHEAEEQRLAAALAAAGSAVPVTSSAGALVRALQRLGASRVAIVAPYLKPLTDMVAGYLAGYGIKVVDSVSLEVADNVEVRRLDLAAADALVLSACVQMPSLAVLDEVSRQTQVPVLTAATATAGEVLELLGRSISS
jgi:maleate isomerase